MHVSIVAAEVPIEQYGTQRRIGADDRPTVFERYGPDDLDISRFKCSREAFRRPAERSFGHRQCIINDERTRPQRARSWIQHGLRSP